jgi:hypothetical protein
VLFYILQASFPSQEVVISTAEMAALNGKYEALDIVLPFFYRKRDTVLVSFSPAETAKNLFA